MRVSAKICVLTSGFFLPLFERKTDRSSLKPKVVSNLIYEKSLVGKANRLRVVGKNDKVGWSFSYLSGVIEFECFILKRRGMVILDGLVYDFIELMGLYSLSAVLIDFRSNL